MNNTDLYFVNAVRQAYNAAVRQFLDMHMSLVCAPPGYAFVYGDSPVIYVNTTSLGYAVGLREGAMWGRDHTKQIVWPASRTTMIVLNWGPLPPGVLTPNKCVQLNQLQLRTTERYLGCHPDDDPSTLLGMPITVKEPRTSTA
jgi:hypothetical protein